MNHLIYNYGQDTRGIERDFDETLDLVGYKPVASLRAKAERRLGKEVAENMSDREIADFLAYN